MFSAYFVLTHAHRERIGIYIFLSHTDLGDTCFPKSNAIPPPFLYALRVILAVRQKTTVTNQSLTLIKKVIKVIS